MIGKALIGEDLTQRAFIGTGPSMEMMDTIEKALTKMELTGTVSREEVQQRV